MFEDDVNKSQLALEEMRLLLATQASASDSLDQKANFLLGAASVILTVTTSLQLTKTQLSAIIDTYWIWLVVAAILYAALWYCSISALGPASFQTPINAHWSEISSAILTQPTHKDALLKVISRYVEVYQNNRSINERKARFVKYGLLLIAGMVAVLVYMGYLLLPIS